MAEVFDGNNFVSKQQAIRQSNNTSGVVVDEVTQIDNRAMGGFSCCQQTGWSFSFSLPHGQKWDIDATDRQHVWFSWNKYDCRVLWTPTQCGILHLYDSPYLRAQSSKDLLREPALHPHGSCLHDSPQLTKQVPIRLVNNQSPMSCIFGVVADNSITKTSV